MRPPNRIHASLLIAAALAVAGNARAGALDPTENGWVHRATGTIAAQTNLRAGPYAGTAEQAARTWLAENAGPLGVVDAERALRLVRVRTSPAGIHVRFRQQGNGTPVWRAGIVVSLSPSGTTVRAVHSGFDPILAARPPRTSGPTLSPGVARARALQALGVPDEPVWIGSPSSDLWILREGDRIGAPARLAYRIVLPLAEPLGDWEVFVGAGDGAILRLTDQAVSADGSGSVFDPDPLTTAETSYGGAYADNGDADSPELNAERFERTLYDLAFREGAYRLEGPFVEVTDFEGPFSEPVSAPDPDGFHFTRSEQGFEDVMCYLHLDRSQRYIQSLGFHDVQNGPIECDPHGLNGQDNSHYIPSQNRLAFGEGGVDDAEDADVIVHEYGHAIQHDIVPYWGGGEQGAMGEGFGDYWAGSHSAGVSLFRSDWVFNWDGHNEFWLGRILDSPKRYPEDLVGQVHSDGEIWSAAWMEVFFECGRMVTDTDMLLHHFYQSGSATMPEAAALAMQADLDLYGGLHAGSLDRFFTDRGFFSEDQFDVPALSHEPLEDQEGPGPYAIVVTVASETEIVSGTVRVRYGIGDFDQEAVLEPTGEPGEWAGEIPGQGGDVEVAYYLVAGNQAGWTGAHPRGAAYQHNTFHVGPLNAIGDPDGPEPFALGPPLPNPFQPETALRFTIPTAADVRLRIFDPAGRVVRTLLDRSLPAGGHAAVWDGRDEAGRSLPTGVYFARLEAAGRTLSRKLVLAR